MYLLLSGQIVPIFANNKKKRLRQALYASPAKAEQTKDFEDLSRVTSSNSHNEWNHGDDCFETNETGPQKQSFPRPQKSNSVINVGNINDSLPLGYLSTRQSHYSLSLNGLDCVGKYSSPACGGSFTGNNRSGLQVRQPVKQDSQLHHSYSVDSARPNSTSFDYDEVRFVTNICWLLLFFLF